MAFRSGSQVNPALGRTDYSPFLAGSLQGSNMAAQGGAAMGQGIANMGAGIAQGIKQYEQNKAIVASAIGDFEGAIRANPELIQQLPQANPEIVKAFTKLQKDGTVGVKDAALLAQFANSYTKEKQAVSMRQLEELKMEMAKAQMGQAQKDSGAVAKAMAPFLPGNSPVMARPAQPFNPARFLQGYFSEGGSTQGLDRVDTAMKMMMPQGADPTSAQRDTEAIIASEIAAGKLNPNDPKALAERRASLLGAGGRNDRGPTTPYQALNPMVDKNGDPLGYGVFDQRTGQMGLMKDGKIIPLPEGARPTTPTGLNRAILPAPKFLDLRETLTNDEVALRRMTEYMQTVKDAKQGFGLLADKYSTIFKTFFDTGALNPSELAAAASTGKLQGLIGASRLEVLSGGVLTEQDALRIIAYLGGDAGALRNKEIVAQAMQSIFRDKAMRYKRHLEDYNIQVRSHYGQQGYSEAPALSFDESVFTYVPPKGVINNATVDAAKARAEAQRQLAELLEEKRKADEADAKKRGVQ